MAEGIPDTRYAKTKDGGHIAYKVLGEGPVDLVPIGGIVYNVEIWQEYEPVARFWRELASITRLVMHDRRGTGLSDVAGGLPNLETRAADVMAVLDEVGSRVSPWPRAAAAMWRRSGRVAGHLWMHPQARGTRGDGWNHGPAPEEIAELAELAERTWGTEPFIRAFFGQDAALTPEAVRWLGRLQRHACGPTTARHYLEQIAGYDVRSVLPTVHVPTVLFERASAPADLLAAARATLELMPQAVFREIGGHSKALFFDTEPIVELVRDFLGVERPAPVLDRVLSTIVFTDIVGSTEHAASIGDAAWREVLAAHDAILGDAIQRYRGRLIKTTGDVLATFDGPARAVFAARDASRAVGSRLGLQIRCGVHTGEIEMRGSDVAGVAVHAAARVMALADPGTVLVSSTVRDLTTGSGLSFEDAGQHELKGVPGRWHLYRVADA